LSQINCLPQSDAPSSVHHSVRSRKSPHKANLAQAHCPTKKRTAHVLAVLSTVSRLGIKLTREAMSHCCRSFLNGLCYRCYCTPRRTPSVIGTAVREKSLYGAPWLG
jgi:hypothetical protein